MDKRVKPLRISTLRSVSSVLSINSPFGDYGTKEKVNEKKKGGVNANIDSSCSS